MSFPKWPTVAYMMRTAVVVVVVVVFVVIVSMTLTGIDRRPPEKYHIYTRAILERPLVIYNQRYG
jgi:hypothetical protein